MDEETLYEDGDGNCTLVVQLNNSGLEITAIDANGNVWGTLFTQEELEGMLVRFKA